MPDSEKRRISAQQLLSDIRGGMDAEQLKQKHGLSDRSLESAFGKLAAAGLLTEQEIPRCSSFPLTLHEGSHEDAETTSRKKCPACDADLTADSPECPACGVIVDKFVALREQKHSGYPQGSQDDSAKTNSGLLVLCFLVVVIVSGGYFLFWMIGKSSEKPQAVAGKSVPQSSERTVQSTTQRSRVPVSKGREKKAAPEMPSIFTMQDGQLLELEFSPEGFPLNLPVFDGSGGIHFFETPDANLGFKELPPETDAKRYYDEFTIAGRTFLMVTDATNPPKIYLDTNRNGDMTDDPGPFLGEDPAVVPNHYTLELPYTGEETTAPYRLWLFSSNMGGIRFYPKCHWVGQIEINGNPYTVITFDGNADGDYSNDPVIIDVNNDGKADDSERLNPGESLTIDGVEVKLLAIAPSGRLVRLQY
jgi:hypothetical protein